MYIWGEGCQECDVTGSQSRSPAFSLAGTCRATGLKPCKAFVSNQGWPACLELLLGAQGGTESEATPSLLLTDVDKPCPIKE